ncbi:MAG: MBL fold metallo-hydrolase [Actinomycetia bacterium]|nr:MBL fold metallo-hydrolase [Actinomycetes bacterium]MCP5031182.1 MBL fold metallo-hydrolase [Actinomycetes bacterium]
MGVGLRYEKGLVEVADGVFAYLQPDGGWGWSNAGLVVGAEDSLLVDTLFDLKLTEEMLASMASTTSTHPIRTVVNTHANGDHCFGNQLVTGAEIIASEASAAEMEELPPAVLDAMMSLDLGETTNAYIREAFGPFTFSGIEPPHATTTFSGELEVITSGRAANLMEVGPAHTAGDVLVHIPTSGVIFTGDILFVGGTPIIWNGPVQNWIDACERIIELDCDVIVPGHGPLTDAAGVRLVGEYLIHVRTEATARFQAGMRADEAARDIELGSYRDWLDWERIVINVDSLYRELDPNHPAPDVMDLFRQMAELKLHK